MDLNIEHLIGDLKVCEEKMLFRPVFI
jgi:hypothetical protein